MKRKILSKIRKRVGFKWSTCFCYSCRLFRQHNPMKSRREKIMNQRAKEELDQKSVPLLVIDFGVKL